LNINSEAANPTRYSALATMAAILCAGLTLFCAPDVASSLRKQTTSSTPWGSTQDHALLNRNPERTGQEYVYDRESAILEIGVDELFGADGRIDNSSEHRLMLLTQQIQREFLTVQIHTPPEHLSRGIQLASFLTENGGIDAASVSVRLIATSDRMSRAIGLKLTRRAPIASF
jgi:hypothetical protein